MRSELVRLYPARWRARYGEEFISLLEERPLGPFDVADVLLGALDAHLRWRAGGTEARQGRGVSMSLRVGGFAAIVGAALLAGAGFLSYELVVVDDRVPPVLLALGLGALLVAMAGLSSFQARVAPRLVWTAFALAVIGTIAAVAGTLGVTILGVDSWALGIAGALAALAGSSLFAVVTYRTAALSRAAAVVLGVGSVLPVFSSGVQPLYFTAVACFLLGWFALGVKAIRMDRPTIDPRAA
jgi:hypothetical protein